MLREIHAAVVGTNSNKSVRGNDVQELPTVEKEELDKLLEGLKEARSLETLSTLGFSYDIGPGVLKCDLCCSNEEYNPDVTGQLGFFQYSAESGTSFKADDVIPRQFRTLKGHLRNHVTEETTLRNFKAPLNAKRKRKPSGSQETVKLDYEWPALLIKYFGMVTACAVLKISCYCNREMALMSVTWTTARPSHLISVLTLLLLSRRKWQNTSPQFRYA